MLGILCGEESEWCRCAPGGIAGSMTGAMMSGAAKGEYEEDQTVVADRDGSIHLLRFVLLCEATSR